MGKNANKKSFFPESIRTATAIREQTREAHVNGFNGKGEKRLSLYCHISVTRAGPSFLQQKLAFIGVLKSRSNMRYIGKFAPCQEGHYPYT